MKRAFFYLILALIVVFPTTMQSKAQDDPVFTCEPEDMIAAIETVEDLLMQARQAATDGDVATALNLLSDISRSATATQAQCRGWHYEGNGSDVLGPLDLDGGVYIIEYASSGSSGLISTGMLTIDFERVDGSETIWDSVMEMRMEAGEFSGKKTIRVDGGKYLISVEVMYLDDWTIQLIKP